MSAPQQEWLDPLRLKGYVEFAAAIKRIRATLSSREQQVLVLVLMAKKSDEISRELGISKITVRKHLHLLRKKIEEQTRDEGFHAHMTDVSSDAQATSPSEEPNSVSSAPVLPEPTLGPTPPLEHLRHFLQTRFPVLYAQVLEPTLADLREEHSAALAEGCPLKARCALLQGCGALAAAAVSQLGYSLLGRIAALWKARSPK